MLNDSLPQHLSERVSLTESDAAWQDEVPVADSVDSEGSPEHLLYTPHVINVVAQLHSLHHDGEFHSNLPM